MEPIDATIAVTGMNATDNPAPWVATGLLRAGKGIRQVGSSEGDGRP